MTSTNKIEIVTFCNKIDDRIQPLIDSCNSNNLTLHILGEGIEWRGNVLKIKLLHDFVSQPTQKEKTFLFVDAFDVIIHGNQQEILKKFSEAKTEILFSCEASFYVGIRKWRDSLYKHYPKSKTIFRYLNSGSFIGNSKALSILTKKLIELNKMNFEDDTFVKDYSSDQAFYSRYYSENYIDLKKDEFRFFKLDYNQELMYCSGGRRAVINWKFNNTLKSNIFSKVERKYIRKKKLNIYQNKFTDLEYDKNNKEFICTTTNTTPNVIHIPGCKGNEFEKLLNTIYSAKQMTNIKAIYYSIKSRVKTEFIFRSPERSFKILRKA